jgi:hypothetical protein
MPYPAQFIDQGRGLLLIGEGIVTGAEFINTNQELLADERVRNLAYALIDLTPMTDSTITPDQMFMLASIDKQIAVLLPNVTVALVATQEAHFGLCRMWEGLLDAANWTTCVFHTRPEAEDWLRKGLWERLQFVPTFR